MFANNARCSSVAAVESCNEKFANRHSLSFVGPTPAQRWPYQVDQCFVATTDTHHSSDVVLA